MTAVAPSLRRLTGAIGLAILSGLITLRFPVLAQQTPGPGPLEPTPLQEAVCLDSGATESGRHKATGAMRFIGTRAGNPLRHPLQQDARTPPEAAARSYLSVCGSLFGVSDSQSELLLERTMTAEDQRAVVRFQQTYSGIPVFGGELIVHLDRDRNVMATIGRILPQPGVSIRPRVTPEQAVRAALDLVARQYGVAVRDLTAGSPQLWIYSETLIGPGQGPAQLVWRTEVMANDLQPIRELVLVDAARGNLALHFNQIETALRRQTYTANNTPVIPGTLVCDESNPTCAGGDAHAAGAHVYAGDTFDFYLANHGRNGIDNSGSTIRSTVHYGAAYDNAFWNGAQMVYGDAHGYPLADDVVAHELTHGVTQYSSNLFYYYQSGAINESLSDVWGEFVDQTNGRGNDIDGVRWLLGEDVTGLGALRSMSNPPAFGDPDRMTSLLYFLGSLDNGGVHTNSGINNKAAFLMVDGGTFNGQTVAGLGITKTAKIYYEAQTHLLTSGADYGDLYYALYQACNNLVGTSDIFPADCQEVRKATVAVEMNLQPAAYFNLDVPLCSAGQVPSSVFFDDLEHGSGNFVTMAGVGSNRWSYDSPWGSFAHSGRHFLYADDYPSAITDSSIAMANGVTLPGNAFLHFAHAYGFENPSYDGGVVEYSTNGGSSWLDAGPLFDGVGYTGTVTSGFGNPLAGRAAFVGDSHGYVSHRLNLSSLAGQNIKFRWRMGLDNVGYDWGWWLDDLRIYTCAGAPAPNTPAAPNPADGSSGVSTNAVLTWTATGATSYDIAFGTVNPPPPAATNLDSPNYAPALAANTRYFWRVTANSAGGSTVGPVWSFTTGAPSADLLVRDTFTGTTGTLLTAHTPDVNVSGAPWSVTGATPIPTLSSGWVRVTPGSGHVQATVQTGAPDIRMGVDYRAGGSAQQLAGLAFRLTDANNHLLLMFYQNALHFYRRQNGTYTLLASSPPLAPIVSGSTQRMEVRASGSQLTGWWNGVQVVQATDTIQQSATRHGLDWNSAYDATALLDNLEIRNTGVPVGPPSMPETPSPADGAHGVATDATLTWSAAGATSYDIAFGTVDPPPPAATGVVTASYTPTLTAGTTYYWQVIARNAYGSTTGPVWTFTTAALPLDMLLSDTFSGMVGTPLTEHLPEVNFGGAPWSVTGGPPTPMLSEGAVGITAGTGHVQATVQTGAPDIRMGVDYRVGGSAQQLAALAFRLTDANNHLLLMFYQNALHFYRRQAGTYTWLASSPTLTPIASGTTQRLEVRTTGTLLTGWWNGVQVVQTTDTIQQSATRHGLDWNALYDPTARFDNLEIRNLGAPIAPPAAPSAPSPADGATGVSTGAVLTWSAAGATSYNIAFGTESSPPTVAEGLGTASYTPLPAMTASTTYYWQVTARNAGGMTPGPVWTFTTAAPPPAPSEPTTPAPTDGATGVALNAVLTWSATGATSYDVALGTLNPPPSVAVGLSSASYAPTLLPSTTYYWRVTARNAGGSTLGPVWTFTTAALAPDILVIDSFAGVTGTPLTLHVPDVVVSGAAAWNVTGGTPIPTLNGGLVGVTPGSGHVQATLMTGAPDIRMGVDYRVGASTQQLAGLAFRLTDANNHLLLIFHQNALHFYRRQSGAYSLLASSAPLAPIASGSTQRLEVRTTGSLLTGWWNGVQVVQATDTFQQGATRHGLDWNTAYDPTAMFDNLDIRNLGAPVGPPGVPGNPSPANGATGVSTSAVLTWSAAGATSYDIAFGTVSPPPTVATGLTSASYTPTLAGNTTYYWAVTARNDYGSIPGPLWTFTTAAAPPDLLVTDTFTGANGTLLTAHNPDLNVLGTSWFVTGATPAPTLTNGLVGAGAGTGHVQATLLTGAPDIRMGVDYRVGGSAQQLAGLVFRFTDTNNHLLLLFYQNALHFYRRQGNTYILLASSGPLAPIASGSTQRMEVRTIGSVLTGWWNGVQVVQAIDTIQQSATRHGLDWNTSYDPTATFDNLEIRNLGVPPPAPGVPGTPSPADGATGVALNLPLTWSAVGATTYDIAFGTASPPPLVATGLGIPGYLPTKTPNTTYYWQITARNLGGVTIGPVWTFTTVAPPPPPDEPTSPSPANGATGVATNSVLTWSAPGATTYDLAFGTEDPPPTVAIGLSSATYAAPLTTSTTYYWRVTARNAGGSTTGPVWSFTTGALPFNLLATDTFTGADGTLLTAHVPDVNVGGAPWSVTGATPIPTLSSGLVGVAPGTGHVQATLQTGATNIRMAADYSVGGSAQQLAALAFRLSDENNHLLLMFYQNALHFYRRQSGTYTLLASSLELPPVTTGSRPRIEVRASGSQLTGWWNGVQVVQAIDTIQQSGTRHGLDWNSAYDATAMFDNLEIYNLGN